MDSPKIKGQEAETTTVESQAEEDDPLPGPRCGETDSRRETCGFRASKGLSVVGPT